METSEFGKGLTYCIGLFLAHAERKDIGTDAETWFDGASDHLRELDVSVVSSRKLKKEIVEWSRKCLVWGHGFQKPKATDKNKEWAIKEAKRFLLLIDRKLLGIKSVNGEWD
jgi:hypothetical protein